MWLSLKMWPCNSHIYSTLCYPRHCDKIKIFKSLANTDEWKQSLGYDALIIILTLHIWCYMNPMYIAYGQFPSENVT